MEIKVERNIFLRTSVKKNNKKSIWFIHGFAESGFSFADLFDTELVEHFNLYCPDLPGFGVSPLSSGNYSLQASKKALIDLIKEITPDEQLYLVGHSIGSVICTWLAQHLRNQVVAFFNIEGNLTKADAYFSGQTVNYESGDEFKESFMKKIFENMGDDNAMPRYYASVQLADPLMMMGWGKSAVKESDTSKAGNDFAKLACRKLYYWGDRNTPNETQLYLNSASIPNKKFFNCGHWPMIDKPQQCSRDILEFFMSNYFTS